MSPFFIQVPEVIFRSHREAKGRDDYLLRPSRAFFVIDFFAISALKVKGAM